MNKIIPAGHVSSIASKAHIAEPMSELEETFIDWKSGSSQDYESAKNRLENVPFNIDDLHHLMLKYKNEPRRKFPGKFLSAGYNTLPENVIVHDLELALEYVGYRLRPGKLLVNRGMTESEFGAISRGLILNIGHTGWGFGWSSKGVIVNAGYAGEMFGWGDKENLAIALQEPAGYHCTSGTQIRPHEIKDELRSYLEELRDICNGPIAGIHQRYGTVPAIDIEYDISKLLREEQP